MEGQNDSRNPVFRICICGAAVKVEFSEQESADVKSRVKAILTGAYEERFQESILECGTVGQTV